MYRKKSRGWYKHKDFILIDLVCLFMALILAYLIRNGSVRNLFTLGIYRNVMIFVILVDLFLIILFESYKGVLRRGRYQELRSVIRQMILIELASGLYLFTVSGGHTFSRIILYLMGIFYVLLSYCTRIIWKKRLLHKMAEGGEHSLYIVTNYDLASKVIQNVKEHNYNRYNINGLILIDKDMTGKEIAGVPVVADLNNAPSFICQQWVDEVFVNVDETYPYPQELIEELLEMGMPVHVNLAKVRSTPGQKQFVEAIGGYTVLTTTMNYATDRQALAKRVLDILGGLVGCFLTGVIFIFIAPAIYISSPGPIFFSQTRIGKNGKPFKMYKFRSMYMDAEERKAELMAQNKMSDGRMFKLDFDPRVIGNKILPDGTRKTGIGEFIRKTSLDEFPQFWNVLNGSMSLVGTRPILQDELRQYELHHRARIAIKPGITGITDAMMWFDKFSCKRSDLVITVGRDLVETVENRFKGKKVPKTVMINNWIDENEIYPLDENNEKVQAFRKKYSLDGKFVIMYSGNIGLYYDLENLIKVVEKVVAGTKTADGREVVFAFVGAGSVLDKLVLYAKEHHMDNVTFIPYQDKADLIYSLNAGDVHWCVNAKGIKGVSCPSKYYGLASAARPVIGVLESGSEIRCIIEDTKGGLCCEPGEYDKVEENIRWFIDNAGSEELKAMGARSRENLEKNLTRNVSVQKYAEEILKL